MFLLHRLQGAFREAVTGLVADPGSFDPLVKPTQDARHGDYQANCAMSLAKQLHKPPRAVAQEIVARLPLTDWLETPEIAGPGFINLRLRDSWVAFQLQTATQGDRIGIDPVANSRRYIVDFSSPNVAKPMHVGHLRSTIIGDALARLYRFLGHSVVTDNHLGDWGTQFGILLHGYKNYRDEAALQTDPVREMVRLYIHVRTLMDARDGDEDDAVNSVADAARKETAKLHAGDPENVRLWKTFMPWCLEEINRIYRRLDVRFDQTLGESFYNPMLPSVVDDLFAKGIAQESEGAAVIFFGEGATPAMVRKKDGAFTYTTTDLATIRYRVEQWRPDTILYVVDSRQALHFQSLFDAARRWGYDKVGLEHISFGSVMAADRKPIKTREGGAVELGELLDEAVERARQVYEASRAERKDRGEDIPDLSSDEIARIAEAVGLGAVKYADLSQNRTSDYVFNWDKMLAMEGNTATYMQYAYARNRSIFRKGGVDAEEFAKHPPKVAISEKAERELALQILRFGDALSAAAADNKPNLITTYLWDLAKAYSGFFQNCPVLKAESEPLRQSRLLLCDLTARTIRCGLDLLGIQIVERM